MLSFYDVKTLCLGKRFLKMPLWKFVSGWFFCFVLFFWGGCVCVCFFFLNIKNVDNRNLAVA